jgi:membrane protease YdiL (CAAX protease family)
MIKVEKPATSGMRETLFILWVVAGLVSLYPAAAHLGTGFPVFTVIWLVVPLIAMLRWRNAALVGFRMVPGRLFWGTTAINLGLLLLVIALFEPWTHAYRTLVREAIRGDATFGWLAHYNPPTGWLLMFIFSGLVTIFAEELFFRGWLLQLVKRRWGRWPAILLQALLFTLLQAIPAFFLSPVQALVWIGVYSFLGVGLINGWSASRTDSIWPGLIAATLMNLIVIMLM